MDRARKQEEIRRLRRVLDELDAQSRETDRRIRRTLRKAERLRERLLEASR